MMKKLIYSLCAAAMLTMVGCDDYDDTDLVNRVGNVENRVTALEELCRQMNTDISSMQTIVAALQNNDYVTSVTPVTSGGETIGYTISFAKNGPITIYHGKDGAKGDKGDKGETGATGQDGNTPVIGVKQDTDGIYYWTLNGGWLTNDAGNKIKAEGKDGQKGDTGDNGNPGEKGEDGITPKLKIESDYWYVSYDNGSSWTKLDQAKGDQGDSFFESVKVEDEEFVAIRLADGTEFKLRIAAEVVAFSGKNQALSRNADGVRYAKVTINLAETDFAGLMAELKTADENTAIATRAEEENAVTVTVDSWENGKGSATIFVSDEAQGLAILKVTVVTMRDTEYTASRVIDLSAEVVDANTLVNALEKGNTKIVLDENLDDKKFALDATGVTALQNAFSGKTAEMDLNGNELDLEYGSIIAFAANSDITFKNGVINISHDHESDVDMELTGAGNLTFDHVTVNILQGNGLNVQGAGKTLTMTDSKVINTSYASLGFVTNASGATKENALPANIILKNTDFVTVAGTAFLNNVPANITATNCRFLANSQAVMLRGGTATFTDCKFYVKPTASSNARRLGVWNQGNSTVWSGLTLGNYNSTSYQYPTNVTMTGKNEVTLIKNLTELPEEYQDIFKDDTSNGNLSTAGAYAGIHIAANQAGDHDPKGNFYGVTFNYTPADLTITGIFKEPAKELEFATANIFVNGEEVAPNLFKAAEGADAIKAAVAAGTPVQLTKDVKITGTDFINAATTNVTIDLNKQKLTLDNTNATLDVVNGAEVVFKNGKLDLTHTGAQSMAVSIKTGGALILEDVELNATSVPFNAQADCAELRIERSKITTTGSYAIATNASNGGVDYGTGGNINLIDSEFTAANVALMNNVPATITAEDCTFTASMQPAFIRAGKVSFTDCTFNITSNFGGAPGINSQAPQNPYRLLSKGWGTGNEAAIGALIIGNYINNSYLWPTTVALNGTTKITVEGSNAAYVPGIHICANEGEGKGVTFNYDSEKVIVSYPDNVELSEGYFPIEFGTTNITVNGVQVTSATKGYVGAQE